jgi:hypothetical protein
MPSGNVEVQQAGVVAVVVVAAVAAVVVWEGGVKRNGAPEWQRWQCYQRERLRSSSTQVHHQQEQQCLIESKIY